MRKSFHLGRNKSTRSSKSPASNVEAVPDEEEPEPIEIDAGRIADMDLDRECILERSRLVSVAPARMPFIGFFGKYNKRWYVDIVSLPHNSIRTLISEVFAMLGAIHVLALDMTKEDFKKAFFFLGEFVDYTKAILDAEEKIIFPEVESSLKKQVENYANHALHPSNRAEKKKNIARQLSAVTAQELGSQPSVTISRNLQKTLDEVSRQLLDYFSIKERELPRCFARSIRGSRDKNRLEGCLIDYFGSMKREHYYTALLTMHLQNADVILDFEHRHFPKERGCAKYRKAARNVKECLTGIPRAFEQAASKYEGRFSVGQFLEHYGKDRDVEVKTQVV